MYGVTDCEAGFLLLLGLLGWRVCAVRSWIWIWCICSENNSC